MAGNSVSAPENSRIDQTQQSAAILTTYNS